MKDIQVRSLFREPDKYADQEITVHGWIRTNRGSVSYTHLATRQAIKEYWEVGEQAKWERHQAVWKALYEGLDRLGFQTIIPRELQSRLVISVLYPKDPNFDFTKIHDYVYERGFKMCIRDRIWTAVLPLSPTGGRRESGEWGLAS